MTSSAWWSAGALAWLLLGGLAGRSAAVEPDEALAARPWRLEAIELRDGRRLEGMVVGPADAAGTPREGDADIEFVQVIRTPGRPLALIAWPPFPADRVALVERLPAAERRLLADRIEAFRAGRRRQDEARLAVQLSRRDEDGPWRYAGPAFAVESTADPEITREAVVRLEQVFVALESLVPPAGPAPALTVRLCGSLAEYRRLQEELGIAIDNPAFYVPARRLLAAGSELPALLAEHRIADDQLDAAEQRYELLEGVMEERVRELAAELEAQRVDAAARADVVRRARQRWSRERDEELARITAARRTNAARVAEAWADFHARLAHEAWHAYADGRLRPPGAAAGGLPAWLDEGLAQVVETAPVEGGQLRLDAPEAERLRRLQQALRAGEVPPLADVVASGPTAFLGGHAGGSGMAYLVAWGLAFDLAVARPTLSAAALRDLVADDAADPLTAFERLVGMPVDRFDRRWRQRMLGLRPRRGVDEPPADVSAER